MSAGGRSLDAFPWARLAEAAERAEAEKRLFPACNSKWTAAEGNEVWCTLKSGGVARDWVGVPRLLAAAGGKSRCACVPPDRADPAAVPQLQEYEGCPSESERCRVPKKKG